MCSLNCWQLISASESRRLPPATDASLHSARSLDNLINCQSILTRAPSQTLAIIVISSKCPPVCLAGCRRELSRQTAANGRATQSSRLLVLLTVSLVCLPLPCALQAGQMFELQIRLSLHVGDASRQMASLVGAHSPRTSGQTIYFDDNFILAAHWLARSLNVSLPPLPS